MVKNEISKSESVTLKVTLEQFSLLNEAASINNETVSDFVLRIALAAVQNGDLDQRIFWMNAKSFEEFESRLNEPPKVNERLKRLFTEPAPWERN